jgi:hypothetical protein
MIYLIHVLININLFLIHKLSYKFSSIVFSIGFWNVFESYDQQVITLNQTDLINKYIDDTTNFYIIAVLNKTYASNSSLYNHNKNFHYIINENNNTNVIRC